MTTTQLKKYEKFFKTPKTEEQIKDFCNGSWADANTLQNKLLSKELIHVVWVAPYVGHVKTLHYQWMQQ